MIGLLYLLFFVVYLVLTIWFMRIGYRMAKRRYQRGWTGALLVGLVMYNLVFWDWIPVLVMHKYYCTTQAGFWVYKTPEEWVKENPEVIGLDWQKEHIRKRERLISGYWHYSSRVWFNRRLYEEYEHERKFAHGISRSAHKLVDSDLGQVLSQNVEFRRGKSFAASDSSLMPYKFWLGSGDRSCGSDQRHTFAHDFRNYVKKLIQATDVEREQR